MHYYSHNIKEFRAGCHNLESRLERWIYRDMIEAYYDREEPFPDDLAVICGMLGLRREAEKEIVSGLLLLKFELTARGWENERCEIELAAYKANIGQASKAGIASAAAKKAAKEAKLAAKIQLNSNDRSTTVEHPLNDRSTESNGLATNQEPRTNNHKPEQRTQPATEHASEPRAVKAVDLSIAFRASGIPTQPANPTLIELASQGVQPETVTAACEEAKAAKPGEQVGLGYVVAILKRWASEAAKVKVQGAAPPARASPGKQPSRHSGFENMDYNEGIENGRIT